MIQILDKKRCCGCGACEQVCPKKCITMTEDAEGFLYPVTDIGMCINCGLCEQACPNLIQTEKNVFVNGNEYRKAYVAYHKDLRIRLKSSSGGVFSAIGSALLAEGVSVYGAAFDDNFMVHHIAVHSESDLEALRGSKYLQSRTEQSFQKVNKELQEGKKVLYTGTPCQISGLKKYLGKEYDGLYTASILCHGTPSPKVWRIYLQSIQKKYGSSVKKISFRDKETGWKYYSLTILFDNQSRYQRERREDEYMQMFLSNICLRPSCYDCEFKDQNNVADIILGDAWGIQNYMAEMDDNRGTSVVIVQNEKGAKLLKMASSVLQVRSVQLDTAWPKHTDSRISVKIHPKREQFFRLLRSECSLRELSGVLRPSKINRIIGKLKRVLLK